MKKIIIGAVVPIVASLGLWLGSGAAAAHATSTKAGVPAAESTSGPDSDNIQSGDQSGPDAVTTAGGAAAKNSSESSGEATSESSGENSSESAGQTDGPGGHEDPPGNVNHECTGNCQE